MWNAHISLWAVLFESSSDVHVTLLSLNWTTQDEVGGIIFPQSLAFEEGSVVNLSVNCFMVNPSGYLC